MRPKRAIAPFEGLHDSGDRNDRRIAGQDRIRTYVSFNFGKQFSLERQIFQDRFNDIVGASHCACEVRNRHYAFDRISVVVEISQVGENTRLRSVERGSN